MQLELINMYLKIWIFCGCFFPPPHTIVRWKKKIEMEEAKKEKRCVQINNYSSIVFDSRFKNGGVSVLTSYIMNHRTINFNYVYFQRRVKTINFSIYERKFSSGAVSCRISQRVFEVGDPAARARLVNSR